MRIAMWSGPRNLSTAMMYSFGARADFDVMDEPFYAAYLDRTGLDHPMREAVLTSQPTDPLIVQQSLMADLEEGRHLYQKHMTQHMIPDMPRDWMSEVVHVFLIRHPARVVASFGAKYENPTLSDIGFQQQAALFDQVTESGGCPVVIDSSDIRRDPETMLRRLCRAVNLSWDPAMLSWPEGGHKDDGVWAAHWYESVHRSTGFAPAEGDVPTLPGELAKLAQAAMPFYDRLQAQTL